MSMPRVLRKAFLVLAVLNSLFLIVVLAGFGMGYQAQQRADMMKSHPYINNDRCVEKVRGLPEPRGGFAFAVIGDIQREVKKLPLLMTSIKQGLAVSFIIQTGDAVAHTDSGHYRLFLNELAKCGLSVPLFVVPGNHDVKNDHNNLFDTYFGSRKFWFEYGNALFIMVDTARGGWDDEKSDWLRNVLKSRRAVNRHAFLFMHNLPLDGSGQGQLIEYSDMSVRKLIEDYNINYVFSGHWHEYSQKEWHGTTFIINGEDDDFDTHKTGAPFCYNLLRVSNDTIEARREVLQPYYVILILSDFKDMFIAHLGDYLMRKPWAGLGMVLLSATGVVVPLVLWRRFGSAAG
jgi:predicted phosphodiesterase